MKKIIFICVLVIFSPIANAFLDIPMPRQPGPGGYMMDNMRAHADLERQNLQNRMLREQIAMIQQRVIMEIQAEAMQQEQPELAKKQTQRRHKPPARRSN